MKKAYDCLKWIENHCYDLRCLNVPTGGGGDFDVEWVIIGHYMSRPYERVRGRGRTVLDAINDAAKNMDY